MRRHWKSFSTTQITRALQNNRKKANKSSNVEADRPRRLSEAIFGQSTLMPPEAWQCPTALHVYAKYLVAEISRSSSVVVEETLRILGYPTQAVVDNALDFVATIATEIRSLDDPRLSIDDLLQHMLKHYRVLDGHVTEEASNNVRLFLFLAIGWLTLLFETPTSENMTGLHISRPRISAISSYKQPISNSSRPIWGLLRAFGNIGPDFSTLNAAGKSSKSVEQDRCALLKVSNVNFATLRTVGKLQVAWTDVLSEHLEFDSSGKLLVFRHPTFCAMYVTSKDNGNLYNRYVMKDFECIGLTLSEA